MIPLRYTGAETRTFTEAGELEPGAEFSVPDHRARGFLRRPDIGHAGECPQPPCRCGEEPAASEDASRSQDADTSGGTRSGRRGRAGSPSGKTATGEQ